MKICIFGAGAVGSHFAVRLALAGHDVSVVARGPHLAAIQATGLTLKAGGESWTVEVRASADPADLGPQDLVISGVKATGLALMADRLGPLVTPETAVLFPQNGIPWWYPLGLEGKPTVPDLPLFQLSARFLSFINAGQLVGGSVFSANAVVEPGVVNNNSPTRNRLSIGKVTADSRVDIANLRTLLGEAGIASPDPQGDIRGLIWSKLLLNMSGSTIALATGNKSSISREDPELREIYLRLMREGLAIAAAHGFPLDDVIEPERVLADIPDHKPSLLQDYELGRPMEIGEIVRAPQAFGRSAGLKTPHLDTLSAIVTRLARDRGLYAG